MLSRAAALAPRPRIRAPAPPPPRMPAARPPRPHGLPHLGHQPSEMTEFLERYTAGRRQPSRRHPNLRHFGRWGRGFRNERQRAVPLAKAPALQLPLLPALPQAWSAAAAISVLGSVLGLSPDAPASELGVSPTGVVGSLRVEGLRLAGAEGGLTVNEAGEVVGSTLPIRVG